MYYLVVDKDYKIIDSCEYVAHKEVILSIYCSNNNINIVECRTDINKQCRTEGLYCYKVSDNQYIVLLCKYHKPGYIFNGYVEKKTEYYLNFIYFTKKENNLNICLRELKKPEINYDDLV